MLDMPGAIKLSVVAVLLGIAVTSRKRALAALVLSSPIRLSAFTAIGHPFLLSELLLIVLIGQQTTVWMQMGRVELPNSPAVLWLLGFCAVAIGSLGYLAIAPAETATRPYNVLGYYDLTHLQPVTLRQDNITQLFLRLFYPLGITVLAVNLSDKIRIRAVLRYTVLGAVFAGVVGAVYQLSVFLDIRPVWQTFKLLPAFGIETFGSAKYNPHYLPRMYSVVGEPGFISDYLLYGFTVTATFGLMPDDNGVFTDWEAAALALASLTLLLLSTGATGYGGVLIFIVLVFVAAPVVDELNTGRLLRLLGIVLLINLVVVLPFLLIKGGFRPVWKLMNVFGILLGVEGVEVPIRIRWMIHAFGPLQQRPLLGVGIGSHNTPTQIASFLVEVGLLGTAAFVLAHIYLFRRSFQVGIHCDKPFGNVTLVLAISGLVLFLTNMFAKSFSALLFPWVWLSVALPLAAAAVYHEEYEPMDRTTLDE